MQLGQIDLNRPLYLNNELTMERLVGGWLLWPGVSDLLQFSFEMSY